MQTSTQARSYRCSYHPQSREGFPLHADTGVQPFVQVKVTNAEDAQRKAHAVTGCPVASVERIEGSGT